MVKKVEAVIEAVTNAKTLKEAQQAVETLSTDLRRKVTPEQRKSIIAMHRRGMVPREIRESGVALSDPTIRKVIRRWERRV